MKVNIFDLMGQQCYSCLESSGCDDVCHGLQQPLCSLLIYPKDKDSNKMPYLQDNIHPTIEDLIAENGDFDYSNCHFISNILSGEIDHNKLEDYFHYQLGILENFNPILDNILLIPDHYAAEKQETLLRHCKLSRNNTLLLWRSVAICLGAEEELMNCGAQEGARVAVVDSQFGNRLNVSILTLKDDSNKLVPARSASRKKEKYPITKGYTYKKNEVSIPGKIACLEKDKFCQHTWQTAGVHYVPDSNGNWVEYHYLLPDRVSPDLIHEKIDFFIICGKIECPFLALYDDSIKIYEPDDVNMAIRGAGRFAVRKANGLPTYYDECESLFFIVQDLANEKITPVQLIAGSEFCRGGTRIEGEINKDFFLTKDNASITFYMHLGENPQKAELKELTQSFGKCSTEIQRLTLKPSMIPGQGIAQVLVDASPLLRDQMALDFLKMTPASYTNKNNQKQPKTVEYLQASLPRSYPIDFPEVKSSIDLYERHCAEAIDLYLNHNQPLPGDCFAHTTWPNIRLSGIEAFERVNIFGSKDENDFPFSMELLLKKVFRKIATDYANPNSGVNNLDLIRLAGWTYQCGKIEFSTIITDVLSKVKKNALGKGPAMQQQEFTVCANILSVEQQHDFIRYFIEYTNRILAEANTQTLNINVGSTIKKVDWWIRALMGILIYSNDVLKDFSSKECESCVENLYRIWINYITQGKNDAYIKKVICCMLFLLRRRKYDHEFLRLQTAPLYQEIMNLRNDLLYQSPLAKAFFEYMQNQGSLEGLSSTIGDTLQNG